MNMLSKMKYHRSFRNNAGASRNNDEKIKYSNCFVVFPDKSLDRNITTIFGNIRTANNNVIHTWLFVLTIFRFIA
ncbi:MAG TPA: hypothetical protein DEQ30_06045 [Porphyromonadaceae bacterium]|nr:hypothetical protein [Porphyromonadaceae bacterium]